MMIDNPIIFTDLDGTLLDHHTYDYSQANEMLAFIKTHHIPLILTTSKTALESELLSKELGITTPMIVENGAGIIFHADHALYGYADDGVMQLGASYTDILDFYALLKAEYDLCGFNEMSLDEVVQYTGLEASDAMRAKNRQFTEPFILKDIDQIDAIEKKAKKHGLRVVKGGRFFHIVAQEQCKSIAMHRVVELYEDFYHKSYTSIALGDSNNDKQMIEQADIGIVIAKHDGSSMLCEGVDVKYANEAGPTGWNKMLKEVLVGV